MILPINDNYRFLGYEHGWALEKRTKARKKGKGWEPFRWFSNLPQAIAGAGDYLLRTAAATNLAEATIELEKIRTALAGASRAQRMHKQAISEAQAGLEA